MCGLQFMKHMDLSDNELYGSVPWDSCIQFHQLETLDLSNNGFEGRLPGRNLSPETLQELDLSSNSFGGTIPSDWASYAAMESV